MEHDDVQRVEVGGTRVVVGMELWSGRELQPAWGTDDERVYDPEGN